ncbi:MAG: DegT/DnrJ/EryC1/StrS family aminotransferase [Bacteroidetes bacterium]|nr:DegT/DnrJ/EryC1/StrS family aminotransferase [Bacteroidota bacterium]
MTLNSGIPDSGLKLVAQRENEPSLKSNHYERCFENNFCQLTKVNHAVALNSGTAALHTALRLLDIKPGDEVICPTFTFIATVNPIIYCNAIPILVDSEKDTWNICPELLEYAIQDRLKKGNSLKAVIVGHTYGMPAKLNRILKICETYSISVIEDAAGALGSTYDGRMVGTFGHLGIYSFNTNKIITTFGGGMLVSKSNKIDLRARFLINQAKSDLPYYQHQEVGYNYKINGLAAKVGSEEIKKLGENVFLKRRIYQNYKSALKEIRSIKFQSEPEGGLSNRWMTTFVGEEEELNEAIRKDLERNLIESRYLWRPMHKQPALSAFPFYHNGVSDRLFRLGLSLPSSVDLKWNDQEMIVEVIKNRITKVCKYL